MKFEEKQKIDLEQLNLLYQSVEWSGYTDHPEKMAQILEGSLWWCACWVDQHLAGLIRVVGDGVSIIYVQDILVKPIFQRQGIGRKLFSQMMEKYAKDIRQIVLITDAEEKTCQFYTSLGLQYLEKTGGRAFVHYNFEK